MKCIHLSWNLKSKTPLWSPLAIEITTLYQEKWEMRKDQTSFAQSFEVTKLLMREGSLWILSTKGKVEFEN